MAVYTPLSDEAIALLLNESYDVGTLVSATGIAEGVENTNYLLVARDGAGEQRYILTLYEKRVNPDDLPFFLGMMEHVAQHGVACPAPLVRRDGAFYGEVAGKQAALISFLNGKSRTEFSPAHLNALGHTVGKLHRATEDFSGSRVNSLSFHGWEGLYACMDGKLDAIAPGLEALVREELSYLRRHWPMVAALPQGVIHADLFPDNVFFSGDDVSGVIDFYFACTDALAYDVAITLNAWCFEPDWQLNTEKSAQFLQAYQTHRALTTEEKQAFPTLLRGAALRFLLTRAYDWLHTAPDALVTRKDPLEYAAKLRAHHQIKDLGVYGIG